MSVCGVLKSAISAHVLSHRVTSTCILTRLILPENYSPSPSFNSTRCATAWRVSAKQFEEGRRRVEAISQVIATGARAAVAELIENSRPVWRTEA